MPLYILSTRYIPDSETYHLSQLIANLHSKEFGTDPALVRVTCHFSRTIAETSCRSYGGPGFKQRSGFHRAKLTDSVTCQILFPGTEEDWAAYCNKLNNLFFQWSEETSDGQRPLGSIYLQRVDYEWESGKISPMPVIITQEGRRKLDDERQAAEAYTRKIKQEDMMGEVPVYSEK